MEGSNDDDGKWTLIKMEFW